MTRTRKITLAVYLTTVVLTAGCGAPTDDVTVSGGRASVDATAEPAPPAKTAKVGGSLTVDHGDNAATWTLVEVRRDKRDDFNPAPSGQFICARLKVTGTEGETFVSPWSDLTVVTATGRVVEQTLGFFGKRKALPSLDIRKGQNAEGWVFFDVSAADAKGAKLQLKQFSLFGDDPVGYWQL
jgi:hypothetical protein